MKDDRGGYINHYPILKCQLCKNTEVHVNESLTLDCKLVFHLRRCLCALTETM